MLESVKGHMDAAAAGDPLTELAQTCPAIADFFVRRLGPLGK